MRRTLVAFGLVIAATVLAALPVGATTLAFVSGGLHVGHTCPAGSASCSASADLTLDGAAPATGSITFAGSGATTVSLTLVMASAELTGAAGATELVEFRNIVLTVTGVPVIASGDAATILNVTAMGAATGTLVGEYEEFDSGGGSLGTTALNLTPLVSGVACLIISGVGQCGVQVGVGGFSISIDGSQHEVLWMFNETAVPEPGTTLLLGIGLVGLAVSGRSRR